MDQSSQPTHIICADFGARGQRRADLSENLMDSDSTICSKTKDKEMEQSSQPTQRAFFKKFGYERTHRITLGPKPGQELRQMKIHTFTHDGVHTGTASQLFPPDLYIRYPNTESQTTEEMFKTIPEMMDKPMAPCARNRKSYWEKWYPAGAYQMVCICLGGGETTGTRLDGIPEGQGGKIPSKLDDRKKPLQVVADLLVTPIDTIAEAFGPYWAIHSEFFSNIELLESGKFANNIYMTTPIAIYYIHFEWDASAKLFEYISHGSFCPNNRRAEANTGVMTHKLRRQAARQHEIRKAQRKKAAELEKALRKKKRQIRQTEQHLKRLRELPAKRIDEILRMSIHEQAADPDHEPNIRLVITEYEPKPTAAELYEQMVREDMAKVQKQRIKRSGRKH